MYRGRMRSKKSTTFIALHPSTIICETSFRFLLLCNKKQSFQDCDNRGGGGWI